VLPRPGIGCEDVVEGEHTAIIEGRERVAHEGHDLVEAAPSFGERNDGLLVGGIEHAGREPATLPRRPGHRDGRKPDCIDRKELEGRNVAKVEMRSHAGEAHAVRERERDWDTHVRNTHLRDHRAVAELMNPKSPAVFHDQIEVVTVRDFLIDAAADCVAGLMGRAA